MTDPQVVFITGARKGIGRYLAEHYLDKGFQVVGCSRGISELAHTNYVHLEADVANEAEIVSAFREVKKRFGRIDALINNAGIASMNMAVLTPGETARRIFETNALGTFLCCREAAKLMRKAGHGRIVNFSTVAVPLNLDGEALYASSKSAIETLTRVLAKEFASWGITVNAIGPTPIATDLIRAVPEEKITALIQRQAIHRLGTYPDVSNIVDFFLRAESDFVTGQILYLGGIS